MGRYVPNAYPASINEVWGHGTPGTSETAETNGTDGTEQHPSNAAVNLSLLPVNKM